MDEIDFAADALPGADLHRALGGALAGKPVARVRFGGEEAWLIGGWEALSAAFRNVDGFPPVDRSSRGVATTALRARAVARMEREGIELLVHELVDGFSGRPEVDLAAELAAPVSHLVLSRLLGIPRAHEERVRRGWDGDGLEDLLRPLVADRRREPREDVLSELVRATIDGRPPTDDEVLASVRLLLAGGGDATEGALGSLLHTLLVGDDLWSWLGDEPALRADAIEEGLRCEPPMSLLPRRVGPAAVEVGGVELPPGSSVLFGIAAANRDPARFRAPHEFDPERSPNPHLSFGPGMRPCPGASLARRTMGVALDVLLERFPRLRLRDRDGSRPVGTTRRGPQSLRVAIG